MRAFRTKTCYMSLQERAVRRESRYTRPKGYLRKTEKGDLLNILIVRKRNNTMFLLAVAIPADYRHLLRLAAHSAPDPNTRNISTVRSTKRQCGEKPITVKRAVLTAAAAAAVILNTSIVTIIIITSVNTAIIIRNSCGCRVS